MPDQSLFEWEFAKKPNTFVVGAPKCGTTAMCDYLAQHPQVFMSKPKEPHFFVGSEMPGKARVFAEEERYARLFDEVEDRHRIVAEGSVWYLYSQTALRNISRFQPDSRIIVMLRRPDEMVYSMHNEAVANFSEDILNFDQAWNTALAGNDRISWSDLCDERSKLDYHRIAMYSEQITRIYKYFPKQQVKVIFYDDFKFDTKICFEDVLNFLELNSIDVNLSKINQSRVVSNRALGRFLRKPPPTVMKISRIVKELMHVDKLGWRDRLESRNSYVQSREPINPSTRAEIICHYRSDVITLGEMCNRDLSHWLE